MKKTVAQHAETINRLTEELTREVEAMESQIRALNFGHHCPLGKILIIQQIVADYQQLSISVMSSHIRTEKWAHTRFIAMYLSCELTDYSVVQIAECFGKRDHAGIIYGRKEIESRIAESEQFANEIAELKLIAANRLREASRIDLKAEMQAHPVQKKTA